MPMTPSPEPSRPRGKPHPLEALACLTPEQIQRLRGRWIESVEALAALAGSDDARAGLIRLLEITGQQFQQLGQGIQELLGPEETARLSQPSPGGRTGVILTEQQKRDLGMPHGPGPH